MNEKFDGQSNYFAYMDIDKIQVWEVTNEGSVRLHDLSLYILSELTSVNLLFFCRMFIRVTSYVECHILCFSDNFTFGLN